MSKFKISVSQVLTSVMQESLERVFVIGVKADGTLYVAGSDDAETHTRDVENVRRALEQNDQDVLSGEKAPIAA